MFNTFGRWELAELAQVSKFSTVILGDLGASIGEEEPIQAAWLVGWWLVAELFAGQCWPAEKSW